MNLTISIVTPSFNQAPFLPECLESVLNQTYKAIEHLVYDPGSPDGSQDVVRRYPHATLIDEPDKGQSDAVSKGFLAAKGDIIGWLNSDDCYASNDVFATVIDRFSQPDAPDIVYGRGAYIDDYSKHLRDAYVNESPETLSWRLHKEVGILQPTLFLRRSVIDKLGVLSEDLNFGMDYEYWIRAMKAGLKFVFMPKVLAFGRYYEDNKTLGKRGESLRELCDIVKNQFGYAPVEWIRRYAEFNVENFDGILADSANRTVTNPEKLDQETKRLLEAYNTSYDTLKFLKNNQGKRPYNNTVKAMKDLGISLEHPFNEIPLDQKTAPYCYCHTVTERRWAFKRDWRDRELEKTKIAFEKLRSERKNDTCILVGNGPSLKEIDFSLLKGQDVFITNYAFLNKELLSYAKYLGVVNYLVAEQGAHQFNLLEGVIKLFPYWLGYCINGGEDTFFFTSMGRPEFSKNMFENVSWRSTVSFFQMQIAYGLGYRRVLMIGFDHNYSQDSSAKEGDILLCDKDDDNHFDPRYFKGKRWQAADVDNMEAMYVLAKQAFEEDHREIINCTVGGKLELFKRGKLEDYVGTKALNKESDNRLRSLKDIHLGKRCVIVGSDSSLNSIDLSFLKYEICFGVDKNVFEIAEKNNFKLNYFMATDESVLEQLEVGFDYKFVRDSFLDKISLENDTIFINTDSQDEFSINPLTGLQLGNGSSYIAMQLAFYMGFQEVILLGVKTTENFDTDRYFRVANVQFRSQERAIIDATINDHESLFPCYNYQQLFLSSTEINSQIIYLDDSHNFFQEKYFSPTTIFTIPHSFSGNQGTIQRNAILSWKSLHPQPEIILFGDAEGTAKIAQELSLIHVPEIKLMGSELLKKVREIAQSLTLAYLQPDSILTSKFTSVVEHISLRLPAFLVLGRCWEIDVTSSFDVKSNIWEKQLQQLIDDTGYLTANNTNNYVIFSQQLLDNMPTSSNNQNLLFNQAKQQNYPIVDSSHINIAVKQNCNLLEPDELESNIVKDVTYQLKSLATKYAPKVSIIIPTYNQSTNINRAIESILFQTVTDYEIIIVDDGSTDDTRKILEPYQHCLKYIHQEEQGTLNACNRGIWLAKGELVTFLNPDDYLLANSLKQQIEYFTNSPNLDLLLSGWQALAEGEITNIEPWYDLPQLEEDLHIWKLWKLWKPLNNSIMMFRRDRLQQSGGFNTNLHPESAIVDLVIRLTLLKGCQAQWLRQPTCIGYDKLNYREIDNPVKLAQDFEIVLDNFFHQPYLKQWMSELEPIARYNAFVWLAWLVNSQEETRDRDNYLQRSLNYTFNSQPETVANWIEQFNKFSRNFDYKLNHNFLREFVILEEKIST